MYRKKYNDKTVLVLYGGPNEHHEIAFRGKGNKNDKVLEGENVEISESEKGYTIVSWDISEDSQDRKVLEIHNNFYVYLLSMSSLSCNLNIANPDPRPCRGLQLLGTSHWIWR